MKRGAPIERRARLEPKRWGVRRAPKKASWRDAFMPERLAPPPPKYTAFELAWFAFVRTLPCCASHLLRCYGPIAAAHATLSANEKGWGMKVPHDQTVPLCAHHHDFWDGRLGRAGNPFADLTRDQRYELAAGWVERTRRAAVPEDRRHADALEQFRIGVVIGDGTPDGFRWLPGWFSGAGITDLGAAGERLLGVAA